MSEIINLQLTFFLDSAIFLYICNMHKKRLTIHIMLYAGRIILESIYIEGKSIFNLNLHIN